MNRTVGGLGFIASSYALFYGLDEVTALYVMLPQICKMLNLTGVQASGSETVSGGAKSHLLIQQEIGQELRIDFC